MKSIQFGLLFVVTGLLFGCGGGESKPVASHEPGGETPKAVVERVVAGMKAKDAAAIASVVDAESADAQKAGQLLIEMAGVGESVEAAKAKFTEEKLKEAMGFGYIMLAAFSPNFEELLAKGTATIDGDTAEIAIKDESEGASMSASMPLVRKDGRWYLAADDLPHSDQIDKMLAGMGELGTGMAEAVKSSSTAEEFVQKVGPLFQKLSETQ